MINKTIKNILIGKKKKLIIAIGPCSIHNINSTKVIIKVLKKIKLKFKKNIKIVFRMYLEKPRTIDGWKGIIYDPYINQTYNFKKGIYKTQKIIKHINKNKIPIITEFLNIDIANLIKDYISIGTIGARTSESQIHRELVSYIKIPCGFKNTTSGNINTAINSIIASNKNNIMIVKNNNKIKLLKTKGNKNSFIILRGGIKPNYSIKYIKKTEYLLNKNNIKTGIMIDCSHSNSKKNPNNQKKIIKYIIKKYKNYKKLIGLMLEVNIYNNNQNIKTKLSKYISITDPCISIKNSYYIIKNIYKKLLKYN